MSDKFKVIAFYDERMLAHQPDIEVPFLPGRMDRRIRQLLMGLGVPWKYPEHPGRLTAIHQLLEREPVPGVHFETGTAATREQLARVHTMATWIISMSCATRTPGWTWIPLLSLQAASKPPRSPPAPPSPP